MALLGFLRGRTQAHRPASPAAPAGVLPAARVAPSAVAARLAAIHPALRAEWHAGLREWHILLHKPGQAREQSGRTRLAHYHQLWREEGIYAPLAKWRIAFALANGWALLAVWPHPEITEAALAVVRATLAVTERQVAQAEQALSTAAIIDNDDAQESRRQQVRAFLESTEGAALYRKVFRGRVVGRPLFNV